MFGGIDADMSEAMKWIGGTSLVAVVLLGSAVIAGNALEARNSEPAIMIEAPAEAIPQAALAEPADAPAPAPTPEPFVIKRVLPIDGPIRYGEWHWNEQGAPAEGPLVITVDLEARVRVKADRDIEELRASKRRHVGDPEASLEIWDWRYYQKHVQQEQFEVDQFLNVGPQSPVLPNGAPSFGPSSPGTRCSSIRSAKPCPRRPRRVRCGARSSMPRAPPPWGWSAHGTARCRMIG